jgi:pimeloyl-ACP methyl ester carboxylesterase
MAAIKTPTPHSQFIRHANGQQTHFLVDDFTDPWKKKETQTVVIQHGFGRHSGFWYHWIPRLAAKYRVVRRDLRGHGLSSDPGPDYDYSIDTVLGELIDLLDLLDAPEGKVHLLCESTAGLIGVAFAARHPDRLHSLTVCATPTHLPEAAKKKWAGEYPDWAAACRALGAPGFAETQSRVPGGITQPQDPDYRAWWLGQMALSTGEGLARYAAFLDKLDVRPLMKDVQCPTLVLAPTNSANTSLQDQEAFRDAIPGARLVPIRGKGHEIYVDKADDCLDAFLEFLSSLPR